jgi:hypothetical protein
MTLELFQKMSQSILDGDSDAAVALAKQAIESGVDPLEAISKGYVIGVNRVGENFANGEAFLPELVMAGEAMKAAVATLEPEMQKRGTTRQFLGKVLGVSGPRGVREMRMMEMDGWTPPFTGWKAEDIVSHAKDIFFSEDELKKSARRFK